MVIRQCREDGLLLADCAAAAEEAAAERIEAGELLRGKLIRAGRMLHPFIRDYFDVPAIPLFKSRKLFDVSKDDTVTYNPDATVRWQRDQAAALAQRQAAAERRSGYAAPKQNGHNGNVVTLAERQTP